MEPAPKRPKSHALFPFKIEVRRHGQSSTGAPNVQRRSLHARPPRPRGPTSLESHGSQTSRQHSTSSSLLSESTTSPSPSSTTTSFPSAATPQVGTTSPPTASHAPYLRTSDDTLEDWLPFRKQFLWQSHRHHGLNSSAGSHRSCTCSTHGSKPDAPASLRCIDCGTSTLMCHACITSVHASNPLHRIECWNGKMFRRTSLQSLGLTVHVGPCGASCTKPQTRLFTVIHTNGLHRVNVSFCNCARAPDLCFQLLRVAWFPASVQQPQTCATFEALRLWRAFSLAASCSVESFYRSLVQITDFEGKGNVPDRQREFTTMTHEWRHIEMLKDGAVGYDLTPVESTKPGQLAHECPSCPHPDKNLPPGWEDEPDDKQYLYKKIVSLDGNFRLQNYSSSKDTAPLGPGFCIFAPPSEYLPFVKKHANEPEVSTCTNLLAVNHAHKKISRGLRATGVVGAICARHEFFLPVGLVDVQLGERAMNADFAFTSGFRGTKIKRVTIVYDIACQWSINFLTRLKALPEHLQEPILSVMIDYALPKLHEKAHKELCAVTFSLNFIRGVGRTDGEGVERRWSDVGEVAPFTREMRSGHRHDTIDDVANYSNYQKMVHLGDSLIRKLREATKQCAEHKSQYVEFVANSNADQVKKWDTILAQWESDHSAVPNPYLLPAKPRSQKKLRLELDRLEAAAPQLLGVTPETSGSALLQAGFELEEEQYLLRVKARTSSTSDAYKTAMKIARDLLRQHIISFHSSLRILLPDCRPLLSDSSHSPGDSLPSPEDRPELSTLHLPSALAKRHRQTDSAQALSKMEAVLRRDQAFEALRDLRCALAVKWELRRFQKTHAKGVAGRTRARTLLDRAQKEIDRFAERYRRARRALLKLEGSGAWEQELKPLNDEDIRSPEEHQDGTALKRRRGTGEGYRKVSWIHNNPVSKEEINEAMRVEYLKAKARYDRWDEEVQLLHEEIRRAIVFFEFQRQRWIDLAQGITSYRISPDIQAGLAGFAYQQADAFDWRASDLRVRYKKFLLPTPTLPV